MMPEELKRTRTSERPANRRSVSERPAERPTMYSGAFMSRSSFDQIHQATKTVSHSFGERVARREAYLSRRNRGTAGGTAGMPMAYHLNMIAKDRKKKAAEPPVKTSKSCESVKQVEVLLSQLLMAESLATDQATEQATEQAQAEMKKKEKKQAKKDKQERKSKRDKEKKQCQKESVSSSSSSNIDKDACLNHIPHNLRRHSSRLSKMGLKMRMKTRLQNDEDESGRRLASV
jgi:Ni/Co efflux regulator RcnB